MFRVDAITPSKGAVPGASFASTAAPNSDRCWVSAKVGRPGRSRELDDESPDFTLTGSRLPFKGQVVK